MLRVRYTHTARADLTKIADYIEQQSGPAVAKGVIKRIRGKVRSLARDGLRYRLRPELGEGRRALLISPYIAFYRVDGNTVHVQRILHGARNITKELLDEQA